MDIARPEAKRQKKIRRIMYVAAAVVLIPLVTFALSKLKPAAPTVDSGTIWPGTVQRGPMVRDVRGLGTLVPETIRLIPAATDGQVQQRYLLPGMPVKADTVIFDLSNPTLQQETLDAEYQLKGAQAMLRADQGDAAEPLMDKRTQAASISSQYRTAEMTKADKGGAGQEWAGSDAGCKDGASAGRRTREGKRPGEKGVETFEGSINSQLAVQQSKVDQTRALCELKKSQLDQLHVKPGIDGILEELDVEVGQKVTMGTVLARVAQPTHLKAQLKIAETQAKE